MIPEKEEIDNGCIELPSINLNCFVFSNEIEITERVLSVIELTKDTPVEYMGWSCSDSAGSSDSGDYSHSHYSDDFSL